MDFDPQKNYYEVLGISEDANADEIKKAFRRLAVKHHPDRGGDKEQFQEINSAYQVLSDEKKRQQYDAYRKGGFTGGFGGFGGGQFGGFDIDLGDLVGDLFGGGGRRSARGGDDVQLRVTLSFDEAYLGVTQKLRYTRKVLADDLEKVTCPDCDGRGVTMQQARTPFGVMQVQNACPTCQGLGKVFEKDGKRVPGVGLEEHKEVIEIEVPGGIKDGVYLKYRGKGHMGPGGGNPGDLYIKIAIKQSDRMRREGDDLYMDYDLTIFDLVLGAKVQVAHPEGELTVKIPKGTQPDDLIKVANKGFGEKGLLGSRGDLYLKPVVRVPKKLSKKEQKLWEELRD